MTIFATDLITGVQPKGYTGSIGYVGSIGYIGSSGSGIKYSTTIGNGLNTTLTVTHSLNTTSVMVFVREVATGYLVYPDIDITGVNTVDIIFVNAPGTNTYNVMVFA